VIAFVTPTETPRRERTRNVALWMVQVVLAAQFAVAGAGRLLGGYDELAGRANRIVGDLWLRSADGSLEPGGAVGVVVPVLFALIALGFAAILVVASVIHLAGLLAWAHWPTRR
jgi:uncharacterized membrane protein YphA (DoxX/SURF4 family)